MVSRWLALEHWNMKLAETKIVAAKAWENILNGRAASETLRAQPGKRLNERKNDLSGATAKLSTNKKKISISTCT